MTSSNGSKRKLVKEILKAAGIKMEIYSCGCCDGITMKFEYRGELIVDDISGFDIDMFDNDEYELK